MPFVYKDANSGEVGVFITWYGILQNMFIAFLLLAFIVWVADERVRDYVPSTWMYHVHEEAKSSSGARAMGIAEYGAGIFCQTLFRSGVVLCSGVIIHHMLFYKKPPRRPRNEAAQSSSGLSYAEMTVT